MKGINEQEGARNESIIFIILANRQILENKVKKGLIQAIIKQSITKMNKHHKHYI